ncbi:hypothetical protein LJC31_07225 [Synergistaceae bacterium OttesenSCG-928-I11]|nr:hypothetical protein [Synergistaceae bacterium OttesenSCG-928-I11]
MSTSKKRSDERQKNRESQRAYRERIKNSSSRLTLVIRKSTHDKLRVIAEKCGFSQGEVIDALLAEGEDLMGSVADQVIDSVVERVRRQDFLLGESAQHCIGLMISFLNSDIREEQGKPVCDTVRLAELKSMRTELRLEQNVVSSGNRNAQHQCIEKYTPIIADRLKRMEDEHSGSLQVASA